MPEQGMCPEDLCRKFASRGSSEGARNHGGLPGERLLKWLGFKSSGDTVLRRVEGRRHGAIQSAVRVLSVDDWAWRKKRRYGTRLNGLGAVTGDRPASGTIRR
jgi:hypothetical protein